MPQVRPRHLKERRLLPHDLPLWPQLLLGLPGRHAQCAQAHRGQVGRHQSLKCCTLVTRTPQSCMIMHNSHTWPAAAITRGSAGTGSNLEAGIYQSSLALLLRQHSPYWEGAMNDCSGPI